MLLQFCCIYRVLRRRVKTADYVNLSPLISSHVILLLYFDVTKRRGAIYYVNLKHRR